ncbi:MAG: hypothetical protein WC900_06230 [Oscillospiraceae bacterium]
MNLILCNAACEYQCDGYCTLENNAAATSSIQSDCCFFKPKGMAEEKKERRQD